MPPDGPPHLLGFVVVHHDPAEAVSAEPCPGFVIAVINNAFGHQLLATQERDGPQRSVQLPRRHHPRAAFFLREGDSAFFGADLAGFSLPPAPSMLRRSASIRLTTLAGRAGAFSGGAGQPACLLRTGAAIRVSS